MELRLAERINDARSLGLRQLRFSSRLAEGADEWSRHLVRRDSFHHGDLRTGMGEVIAWGTCDWFRPGRAVRMWLRSSGHRELVLRRGFRAVGTGWTRSVAKLRMRRDGRRSVPLASPPLELVSKRSLSPGRAARPEYGVLGRAHSSFATSAPRVLASETTIAPRRRSIILKRVLDALEELELSLVAAEALALPALDCNEHAPHERGEPTGLNGFVMYSRPPRSIPRARSRTSARAVRKTIGMSRVTGSSRSISATRRRRGPASSRRGG